MSQYMKHKHQIIKTKNYHMQNSFVIKQTGQEAWRYHWISTDALKKQIEGQKSSYYTYLQNLID